MGGSDGVQNLGTCSQAYVAKIQRVVFRQHFVLKRSAREPELGIGHRQTLVPAKALERPASKTIPTDRSLARRMTDSMANPTTR